MLERGATLGRFAIEHPLAQGDTSTVYLARDPATARGFALKLYSLPFEPLDADRGFVERLSSTAPEEIVRIFEIGRHELHPFVVMELVEGEPLSAFIERRPTVALWEKLRWLQALCAAVACLHELGVVHGRVTPARIVLTDRGHLKLLGLPLPAVAARASRASPDIEVAYRAPERIRGEAASAGADVFAIGAIGYELLTYAAPFAADTPDAIAARVLLENPTPLLDISPDVPLALAEFIDKALAKDPSVRFPDAVSMNAALSSIQMELPTMQPGGALPTASIRRPPQDVQFTVYRPRAVRSDEWRRLLAFMHLAEQRPDAPAEEPSPLEKVEELAHQTLGKEAKQFSLATADGRLAVPREGEITLIPVVEGVEFKPERRTFRWVEDVHQETFLLRAQPEAEGTTVRGRMAAYLGVILLAEVDISIRVDAALGTDPARSRPEPSSANAYRRIFASYSRRDREIVRQFELFAEALGDRYLIDVRNLPAGADWRAGLRKLIHDADVFQLFWSKNSMRSEHVREECEYAMSLNRPAFVRPTYWEEPMPASPSEGLPPETLKRLHFHRLCWSPPAMVPPMPRSSPIERRVPREEQVAATLAEGWRALAGGDVTAAGRAAKVVLLLDSENREAVDLYRAVEDSSAERKRNQQLKELVFEARRALEIGDLEGAERIIAELATIAPNTEDIAALRERVRHLRYQQELARQRSRRDAEVRAIVERARRALERGELDAAEVVLLEARVLEPDGEAARHLTSALEQLRDERRRVEAERARQIEAARREEERRRHAEARQAERQRAEEQWRAEEQRKAEEQRRAEEAAQRAQADAYHCHEELLREREERRHREDEERRRMAERALEQEKHRSEIPTMVVRPGDTPPVGETTRIRPAPSATRPTIGGPARHAPSVPVPKAMLRGAWRYLGVVALLIAALVLGLWLFSF